MNIYQFKVENANGELVSLEKYQGKVLLIVNTASKCGLTKMFTELEALYQSYPRDKFEILGFPCNQFLHQAPEDINEYIELCHSKYNVTFEQFNKIDVNGKNETELYKFLKDQIPNSLGDVKVQWNFERFIINQAGEVVHRFSPKSDFELTANAIKELVA